MITSYLERYSFLIISVWHGIRIAWGRIGSLLVTVRGAAAGPRTVRRASLGAWSLPTAQTYHAIAAESVANW